MTGMARANSNPANLEGVPKDRQIARNDGFAELVLQHWNHFRSRQAGAADHNGIGVRAINGSCKGALDASVTLDGVRSWLRGCAAEWVNMALLLIPGQERKSILESPRVAVTL
jgi:hypothetical protein